MFLDLALDCGYTIDALYHYNDDLTGQRRWGFDVRGSFDDLFAEGVEGRNFLLTMGDMKIRRELTERIHSLGGRVPTLIHPRADVSRWADISPDGVLILNQVNIQADTHIASDTIILAQTNIAHCSRIGRYCFISTQALVGAYTNVEDEVFFGQGALAISEKVPVIGHGAYIGARALLTREVPPYAVMAGSPARVLSFHTPASASA